jgi:hypothetical protein
MKMFVESKVRPAGKAGNLTAICEPITGVDLLFCFYLNAVIIV